MSSYFILEPACNTIETGSAYPQVQKMAPGYDYYALNSVHALSRSGKKFPDFVPNLDHFVVNGKAKLTDLLSVATLHGGFLISEKLKSVLENFKLPPHKFYDAKVFYKKQFHSYYWMHIICDLTDLVDYSNSVFFIYVNYAHNLGHVPVASKIEYLQKKDKVKKDNPDKAVTIWAEKIKMTPEFDTKFDLFEIGAFDSNYYISLSLKEAIEGEKISGCSIRPAKNIF